MKKFLPILILVFFVTFYAEAQITITSADMPSSGDTIRLSTTTNFSGIIPETTDTNYTWDYSTLVPTSQTVDTFVSTLSTGLYAAYFFSASFAMKSNSPPVNLGVTTVDYQYDFFKKNSSAYVNMGRGASVSGLPVGAVNNPVDTLYRFPLNYNDISSTASAFGVTVPTLGYYGGDKTRVDTVDGWGTLITPYGTYDVLRVKSVVNETDSVYITTVGFGLMLPLPESIEYKWLTLGKKIPLLQITTTAGVVSDVVWRDSLRTFPTGIEEVPAGTHFSVYPNPVHNILYFAPNGTENVLSKDLKAELYNILGEKVLEKKSTSGSEERLDMSSLPAGTYVLKIISSAGVETVRVIK